MKFTNPKLDAASADFEKAAERRFRWLEVLSGDTQRMEAMFAKAAVPTTPEAVHETSAGRSLRLSWSARTRRVMFREHEVVGSSEARPLLDQPACIRAEVHRAGLLEDLLVVATKVLNRESEDAEPLMPTDTGVLVDRTAGRGRLGGGR